jgi:hypothetical protein
MVTDTITLDEGVLFTGFHDNSMALFTRLPELAKRHILFTKIDFIDPHSKKKENTFYISYEKFSWVDTASGKGNRLWCSDRAGIYQIDLSERDHWQEFKLFRITNLNPIVNTLCDLWSTLFFYMVLTFTIYVLIHMDDLMP